jgi:hypothetical protein
MIWVRMLAYITGTVDQELLLSLVSVAMTPLAVEVVPQTAQRNQRPILFLMMSIVLYIGLPRSDTRNRRRSAARLGTAAQPVAGELLFRLPPGM